MAQNSLFFPWVVGAFAFGVQAFAVNLASASQLDTSWTSDATNKAQLLQQHDDQRLQSLNTQPSWQIQPQSFVQDWREHHDNNTNRSVHLSDKHLQDNPELLVRALSAAVLNHRASDVRYLLPLYETLPVQLRAPLLQQWAHAIVLESQSNYAQAIEIYTALVTQYPQVDMLRLRAANAFFVNKQYAQASEQYQRLMAADLPKPLHLAIEQRVQSIKTQQNWQLQGGGNFLNDKNINNSPKNRDLGGGWIAPEPQSAQGVAANVALAKKWFLPKGFYAQNRTALQGKYYWDNKGYNEATARLTFAMGHQDVKQDISVAPFVEKSWYADGRSRGDLSGFSTAYGVSAQWQQLLHPQWQSAVYAEISKQDYQTRQHLDGINKSIGAQLAYHQNPWRSWFVGADYQKTDTQLAEDSFRKKSAKAGVMQAWQNGLATQMSVHVAQKAHQQAGFFGKIQRNTEYIAQASLWHQRWQIHSITPRLTWQYQKTDSNLPLYRHDKQQIFVELSKQF